MSDKRTGFVEELEALINKYSKETESNTPDFILAKFMRETMLAFNAAVQRRDRWYNFTPFSQGKAPTSAEGETR